MYDMFEILTSLSVNWFVNAVKVLVVRFQYTVMILSFWTDRPGQTV